MDLNSQEVIKRLADEHGSDNLVVILGAPDDESAEIAAEIASASSTSAMTPIWSS